MFDGRQDGDRQAGGVWTWVMLLCAAVVIFFVCLLFHQLCEPAPSTFEQAVFYAIIFLIFLETVYSGLYRAEE
jgi:hypothetical protein